MPLLFLYDRCAVFFSSSLASSPRLPLLLLFCRCPSPLLAIISSTHARLLFSYSCSHCRNRVLLLVDLWAACLIFVPLLSKNLHINRTFFSFKF